MTGDARYRRSELLGAGAFASVWRGHDEELDVAVAVKVLAENWARRPAVRRRFLQEARILRQVSSRHVVRVFDLGEADGLPYLVMTLADQGTLQDLLARGAVPLDEAVGMMRQICAGVGDLHGFGVIHRDLKPANILIATDPDGGRVLLVADLGLAKAATDPTGLTVGGTPGYMAPEQRQPGASVDERTDVYALGAITFHLLTGEPPAERNVSPRRLRPGLPVAVDEVVVRALEPERERRWESAAAFAEALALSAAGGGAGRHWRVRRRLRQVPRSWVYSSLGLVVGAGAATPVLAGLFAPPPSLREGTDIPAAYHDLIIDAGTKCELEGLSPPLIAAMLKAESGFDPRLVDDAKDEYGVARWTPRVLAGYLPPGADAKKAAFDPRIAIPKMGELMCRFGPMVLDVRADPALRLAAVYRTSAGSVRRAGGIAPALRPYMDRVRAYMAGYRP
ncbi:serine/threonine-protein kinase [Bailinhaonella thermotolerans]|uniref:non-specific serine/threonine protein kinase n=1 Tax=Bailinhaonella thermotolerans TaxID=1070861 RepID=A0A3A4AWW8_9ACTN|nr:serine/threonine-protein kinase [Bailinhaonella thermotolerans]RJL31874.1 serine/threonine protein kinase [Bailinhaonella thermotolerans]